jgi:hypothetical protein
VSANGWLTKPPTGYEGYPPHWRVLNKITVTRYNGLGFAKDIAYARRFGARYRFATSVTEVKLKNYASAETQAGYSALTRLAFTWTAFDSLLALIGLPRTRAGELIDPRLRAYWIRELTQCDPGLVLFRFVAPRVTMRHEITNIGQFLRGQGCDVTALAACLRHVFFHGELTPNAGGVSPQAVCDVCEHLIGALVHLMDVEIAKRLEPLAESIEADEARARAAAADDDFPF